MPGSEEIQWVKATANELNNLLQVISESSQVLETICTESPDSEKYFAILRSGVDRATKVTRMMVDRVGGYQADVGPGAKVEPPAPVALPTMPQPSADVRIYNPTGKRELVMIVDDEDLVTMLAQRVLTDEGYRIVTAKDGFQAIEIYRKLKEQIALIILDFTMPIMDGSDVFAELLQINPKAPVVLSSGFAEQERLRSMLARGLRGFIPKPYTQQKLLTQIRSVLDTLNAERSGERRIFKGAGIRALAGSATGCIFPNHPRQMKLPVLTPIFFSLLLSAGRLAAFDDDAFVRENGTALFEDHFERHESTPDKEEIGNGWTTNSASRAKGAKQVSLEDGALHATKAAVADHAVAIFHDAAFQDGAVRLRFKLEDGDDLEVEFVDHELKTVHAGHLCSTRVTLKNIAFTDQKTGGMDNAIREKRLAGDKSPELLKLLKSKAAAFPVDLKAGEWHTLLLVVSGEAMRATIDDKPIGEFKSAGIAHPTKRVLVLGVNKSAWIDDVKVWSLKCECDQN